MISKATDARPCRNKLH